MKTCFKCNEEKPLGQFYTHPRMADGHLGKCKECTKADSQRTLDSKKNDPAWVEKELERSAQKYLSRKARGIKTKQSPEAKKRWLANNKHKNRAHWLLRDAVKRNEVTKGLCEECGSTVVHAHHDDYNKPYDVRWLCPKHHSAHHRAMNIMQRANTSPF